MVYPFCYGVVFKAKKRRLAGINVDRVYRIKWDIPQFGTSDWLSFNDLLEER